MADKSTPLLVDAVKKANYPCLLVNKRGEIQFYSSFFKRALRRQPALTLFDLLPGLNHVTYKKYWGKNELPSPYMDMKFAENQTFPTQVQFLPVLADLLLVQATLPASGGALLHLLPLVRQLEHALFWEISLISNQCLLSGGQLLQQIGLESGIHQLTRLQLRRLLNRHLPSGSRQALSEHWATATKEGKQFQIDLTLLNPKHTSNVYRLHAKAERSQLSTFRIFGYLERVEQLESLPSSAGPVTDFDLTAPIRSLSPFPFIKTRSRKYLNLLFQVQQVATTATTVLITGETGTGKELLARAIHQSSKRRKKPFIKVNCSAIPENLIESQLFGHEKGAFTGAHKSQPGYFARADGGTLFLDEVGELSLNAQVKLLRVLQEGTFHAVGGTSTQHVDIRVIAATNQDLKNKADRGQFRADLYFRLCVFPIHNLPLRARRSDLEILLQHFIHIFSQKYHKPEITAVTGQSMTQLKQYDFPGNIRELENRIERAVILCQGARLEIPVD